jgi:hypothetical protein
MPNHNGLFDTVIYTAEVKQKISPGDTYKRNTDELYPAGKRMVINQETGAQEKTRISSADMLFGIDVQYTLNGRLQFIENVKPINSNIKQIPIPGESVLIFQSLSHESTLEESYPQWYYMLPMAMSSNTNSNILPTVGELEFDTKFEESQVSPLQPYRGDFMLEGRYGNSIRFSSTIDFKNNYSEPGNWRGNKNGDPILILSNGRKYKENKDFVTEDINTDQSSLYLTSTQKLPLVLGSKTQPNSLTGCISPNGNETNYIGSQLVGVSDRVILKARKDLVVIDSPIGIVLNSTGAIKLGSEEASESMVHGEVLLEVLQSIINQLNTMIQCGSSVGTFINLSYANKAQKQLQELLSSQYKMEFKPNK